MTLLIYFGVGFVSFAANFVTFAAVFLRFKTSMPSFKEIPKRAVHAPEVRSGLLRGCGTFALNCQQDHSHCAISTQFMFGYCVLNAPQICGYRPLAAGTRP
jgi:hypothetical protein